MSGARDSAGRFRPGQTGNPKGRPKTRRGVDAAVTKALAERIAVVERGRRVRKTKLDVTATQLANKGASGDLRAAKMVIEHALKAEERAEANAVRAPVTPQTDREIAARVIARLTQFIRNGGTNDPGDS